MKAKEAMDSGVSRRRGSAPKAGSVWETRMKLDQVKGGIRVFNVDHQNSQQNAEIGTSPVNCSNSEGTGGVDRRDGAKQSPVGSGKRKTWKSDGLEGSPIQIGRKVSKNLDDKFKESSDSADGNAKKIPVQIQKTRPVSVQSRKVGSESAEELEGSAGKFDNIPLVGSSRSEEELGACEVKEVSRNADNINTTDEEENGEKIEVGIAEKNLEIEETSLQENEPKKSAIQEKKKLLLGNPKTVPPAVDDAKKFRQNPTKINPIPDSDNFHGVPRTRRKLQSFADLIMWRDAAKSSFIFGIGTFAIISSSYTNDLDISFISVVSYLGLACLAVNFLFRSLVSRGTIDNNTVEDHVIGEEEAMWVIKLLLPYVNEFLLKLRAFFSGDPATTLKLAVLLFVLARCGSSITMWKMAKLGFIGVFTVPKVCSSYSVQITAHGTFWIRRFSDAWESCSHKIAVGFAVFSLVWNLSSAIARIWTVFMLYVAFKCYQHSLIRDEYGRQGGRSEVKVQRQTSDPSLSEGRKTKKVY